ncbi:uncharacterized protein YceH (UPF0502 family) [Ereboglobus sp. PH5-5]|nr:uncharacterized protein YceH (UPF0502 family) [Ereboglobus sp. PH5-5]
MLARMTTETQPDLSSSNPNTLSPLEARVLGCLIEKELTTPDIYPLTLNALVNAANQRNNRNPILAATHEDIEHALDGLRQKRLATHFAGAEARVAKFRHMLDQVYPMEPTARVILAELLLRGPQTTAELRTRGERMAAMPATIGELEQILADLAARAEPLARKLPPQRGQKEARWAQLLTGEPAADAPEATPVTVTQTLPPEVEQRLAALEAEVACLRNELETLHKALGGA